MMMRNYLLLILMSFSSFLHATELQVIPLNYRSAEEIIPLVRPLIDNNANDDILQAYTRQRNTTFDDNISQQVRTISGRPAYITIGQSRPIPQQQTTIRGNQTIQTQNTYYQDSNTGFYVTPRVHGAQVTLQIGTQRQQPDGFRVESSQISTSVQGKLGEWIALGGSDESSKQSGSRLFQENSRSSNDLRNVSVRVTLVH